MIKAYLAGIPSLYEGEDIEVRYCIFEDEQLLSEDSVLLEYKKPAIVGHTALLTLLKELEKHREKEIVIVVNNGALYECVKGTSTTKNKDVLKKTAEVTNALAAFEKVRIEDVSGKPSELKKWNEILQP